MTDYSTWPNARINYYIACMTGCKLEVTPEDGYLPWLRLLDKDDHHIKDTDVAWKRGMETRCEFWSWGLWANDANMALGLIAPFLEISILGDDVELIDHERNTVAIAKGKPARAICICWLMWQDALNPVPQPVNPSSPQTQ